MLYSTAQAAEELGLSSSHTRAVAIMLNVGQRVGRTYAFTAEDIAVMRKRNTKTGPPITRISPKSDPVVEDVLGELPELVVA